MPEQYAGNWCSPKCEYITIKGDKAKCSRFDPKGQELENFAGKEFNKSIVSEQSTPSTFKRIC